MGKVYVKASLDEWRYQRRFSFGVYLVDPQEIYGLFLSALKDGDAARKAFDSLVRPLYFETVINENVFVDAKDPGIVHAVTRSNAARALAEEIMKEMENAE
jgi:hypothetical protein